MLCFSVFRFSRVTEVLVQVKCALGKAILHKLPIYNEYVLVLSLHIIWLDLLCFPIVVKALLHGLDPYIFRFTCVVSVPRSYVTLLAM